MTNMSIQPLWLTYFIEILLVLEFQLTKLIVGTFSYKAYFRPQISFNESCLRSLMLVFINGDEIQGRIIIFGKCSLISACYINGLFSQVKIN